MYLDDFFIFLFQNFVFRAVFNYLQNNKFSLIPNQKWWKQSGFKISNFGSIRGLICPARWKSLLIFGLFFALQFKPNSDPKMLILRPHCFHPLYLNILFVIYSLGWLKKNLVVLLLHVTLVTEVWTFRPTMFSNTALGPSKEDTPTHQ